MTVAWFISKKQYDQRGSTLCLSANQMWTRHASCSAPRTGRQQTIRQKYVLPNTELHSCLISSNFHKSGADMLQKQACFTWGNEKKRPHEHIITNRLDHVVEHCSNVGGRAGIRNKPRLGPPPLQPAAGIQQNLRRAVILYHWFCLLPQSNVRSFHTFLAGFIRQKPGCVTSALTSPCDIRQDLGGGIPVAGKNIAWLSKATATRWQTCLFYRCDTTDWKRKDKAVCRCRNHAHVSLKNLSGY